MTLEEGDIVVARAAVPGRGTGVVVAARSGMTVRAWQWRCRVDGGASAGAERAAVGGVCGGGSGQRHWWLEWSVAAAAGDMKSLRTGPEYERNNDQRTGMC